jgi:hypothetical protein
MLDMASSILRIWLIFPSATPIWDQINVTRKTGMRMPSFEEAKDVALRRLSGGLTENCVERLQKCIALNRFVEEARRTMFQGTFAQALIGVRGYENYWNNAPVFHQAALQLRSAHAG